MGSSGILDLLIGLVLLYFLLSTLCLALQELVSALLATRAKVLYAALQNMLHGKSHSLLEEFIAHPCIRGISGPNKGADGALDSIRGEGAGKPSYIPAGTFCDVLIDVLLVRRSEGAPKGTIPNLLPRVEPSPDLARAGVPLLTALHDAVQSLEESGPKRALVMALNEARGDVDRARAGIEAWFNGTMERASGWYKRRAQAWLLVYAVVLTALLNADTIMVARVLTVDGPTRTAVAEFATRFAAPPPPPAGSPNDAARVTNAVASVGELISLTQQCRLPLGWSSASEADPRRMPAGSGEWLRKLIGLIVTALAVSLGAPFWFDLLNKFVNLRSTGARPDPNRAEPPPTPGPPPFQATDRQSGQCADDSKAAEATTNS